VADIYYIDSQSQNSDETDCAVNTPCHTFEKAWDVSGDAVVPPLFIFSLLLIFCLFRVFDFIFKTGTYTGCSLELIEKEVNLKGDTDQYVDFGWDVLLEEPLFSLEKTTFSILNIIISHNSETKNYFVDINDSTFLLDSCIISGTNVSSPSRITSSGHPFANVGNNGKFNANSCKFIYISQNSSFIILSNAICIIDGSSFSEIDIIGGGFLLVKDSSELNITNSVFTKSYGLDLLKSLLITIESTTINSKISILDSNFTDIRFVKSSLINGALISLPYCEMFHLNNTNFMDLKIEGREPSEYEYGGVFYIGRCSTMEIFNTQLSHIHFSSSLNVTGGGLYIDNIVSKLNFTNVSISFIRLVHSGGGVYLNNCDRRNMAFFKNLVFKSLETQYFGGAVVCNTHVCLFSFFLFFFFLFCFIFIVFLLFIIIIIIIKNLLLLLLLKRLLFSYFGYFFLLFFICLFI
jgi:hypothetical protein